MSAAEELEAARRDYGTPEEREQRAAQARAQLGQARTNGNAAAGAWRSQGGAR
ncbi:hypothetical protein RM572_00655 [Streptomyces sp. DSM 42041]|uniref:Uncharacterized protein n=1 Tax=Streptomyces hazeniae TaxID=3075538 RepID=A0ABU2NL00_9ACTN|nr:hypothetical protein [Streptomyces sp. DSM 42041]MDT0377286.1 hypothetical protein [Streptomyces sp. DSM 42041]